MQAVTKRVAALIQKYPRRLIIFWIFVIFTLIAGLLINNFLKDFTQNSLNLQRAILELGGICGLLPLIICPFVCYSLTFSLPIAFSVGLSSLLAFSLLQLLQKIFAFSTSSQLIFIISLYITISNVICLKRNWDSSRKGPCTTTIGRLLLTSIDKSLYPITCSLLIFALYILSSVAMKPLQNSWTVLSSIFVVIVQNICSFTLCLSLFMIKNNCTLANPPVPDNIYHCVDHIQRKFYSLAHSFHQTANLFLSPICRFIIILVFLTSTFLLGSVCVVYTVVYKRIDFFYTFENCQYPHCIQPFAIIICHLLLPLPILHLANRHRWSSVIAYFSLWMILICSSGVSILIWRVVPSLGILEGLLLHFIAIDGPFRLCIAHTSSSRLRLSARVIETLEHVFHQIFISTLILISFSFLYIIERDIWRNIAVTAIFSLLQAIFFCPSVMLYWADWDYCGAQPIQGPYSERSSLTTDFHSSSIRHHDTVGNSRKYSHVSTHGIYQKRSFCNPSSALRRASMPVVIQQRLNHKAWADLAKTCQSMDSTESPTLSSRSILRREVYVNSRGSVVSSNSLTQPIIEEKIDLSIV